MPEELFRTQITSRDPRYSSIISLCSWSMAGIFLGMFLTLSGVMLTPIDENEHHEDSLILQETSSNFPSTFVSNQTLQNSEAKEKDKEIIRHFFGLFLLISGCLLIIASLILLMVASLLYLRTTTRPPVTNDTDPEPNTVWNYLDSIDQSKQINPEIILRVPSV